jgi:hypothetical protein
LVERSYRVLRYGCPDNCRPRGDDALIRALLARCRNGRSICDGTVLLIVPHATFARNGSDVCSSAVAGRIKRREITTFIKVSRYRSPGSMVVDSLGDRDFSGCRDKQRAPECTAILIGETFREGWR